MLKRLYEKSEIRFAVLWIVTYCVLMSLGDALSDMLGLAKSVTLCIGVLLSVLLLTFLKKNGLLAAYGLRRSCASARSMLYYLPACLMLTANLWYGVTLNYGIAETVLYILSMLSVGLLEELIFRGLLFEGMRKQTPHAAVIVSSITFGIGHIVNLVNGSGADLLSNLLQVVYATAAGFMFVMIYLKTKSLIGCILIHGSFNALSVFANDAALTPQRRILSCLLLTLITGTYAAALALTMKPQKTKNPQ